MNTKTLVRASLLALLITSGCAAKRAQTLDEPKDVPVAVKPVAPTQVTLSAAREDAQTLPGFDGAVLSFEFNSSQLTAESTQALQSLAETMRAAPAIRVNIAGHCDERGTTEFNLALGNMRAEIAKKYLVALGVSQSRVSTISYGEEAPAHSGQSEAAHAANRRDVIASQ